MNRRKSKKNIDIIIKKLKFTTLNSALAQELKSKQFRKVWKEPTGDPFLDTALTIIKMRKEKNLTQAQLAQKAGTTQAVISRIENMTVSPSISLVQRIANSLGKKLEIKFIS